MWILKRILFFFSWSRETLWFVWQIGIFQTDLFLSLSVHSSSFHSFICPSFCVPVAVFPFIFTYSTHTLGLFDINNVMNQVHQDWSVRATWAILNQYIVFILLLCTGFYIILCLLYEIDSLITSGIILCVCVCVWTCILFDKTWIKTKICLYLVSVQL